MKPDVDCGRVPAILKGEISYINGTTYLASQVSYECTPGNRLSGHRVRFCGPDGRWTGSSPKCEEVRCDAPELPTNGSAIYIGNDRSFKEQSFSVGVTVQYECDYGHVVKGTWSSRLCQANGEWSGEPPVCKFVDCGMPPSIENGNFVLKHPPAGSVGSATPVESIRRSDSGQAGTFTYYGTIAHYNCDANYKIQGPAQRECLDSGRWRTPLPTCESIQCPKPEFFDEYTQVSLVVRSQQQQQQQPDQAAESSSAMSLRSAIRLIANNQWINHDSSQSYGVGDKLYYSCVPGFELYGGPEVRTCTQYGQWSGSSTPRCRLIDCGRPAPIGQEGRFYLLNDSTTFNSLVEYSCVRPFKLVEMKIRQAGNLIEILNTAQAGVTPILTSLPIGVKVCANNGQWMPNDQQPKCVSPSTDVNGNGQFDGADNSLDSSQRIQVLAGNPPTTTTFTGGSGGHDGSDNNLGLESSSGHQQTINASGNSSLWAKIIVAMCLLVMLSLIILTLICIRSGKKPKHQAVHRASVLTRSSGHHQTAAAAAAAMQLQLASGVIGGKPPSQHQHPQLQQQQPIMLSTGQNIYVNGAHKMFTAGSMQGHHHHQLSGAHTLMNQSMPYGDASTTAAMSNHGLVLASGVASMRDGMDHDMMIGGKSGSIEIVGERGMRNAKGMDADPSMSSGVMLDTYSRLSIESDQTDRSQSHAPTNKTIRHNPNGLVTFVSPAQQINRNHGHQQQQQHPQQQQQQINSSQHQISPHSISTSLSVSSSSSPSSSSSAHHTTATRLSTADSSSSSSSNSNGTSTNHNGQYQTVTPLQYGSTQQPSPPSLPAHPPPPHRLQQHHKQLMKQQQQQLQQQGRPSESQTSLEQQHTNGAGNHHYMEPNV